MTRTVDVVIVGSDAAALVKAINALGLGLRVLMVIRERRTNVRRDVRRMLLQPRRPPLRRLTVITGAEVACVGCVDAIEAVIIRRLRTRQLIGFNARSVVGRFDYFGHMR